VQYYFRGKPFLRLSLFFKILSILKDRKLTNREIRQITGLSRYQVIKLIHELEAEGVNGK
jgi:ATP-dependent DNA helicase RecG